ncbi:MAG TPA: cation diffusion facilitator family transporter [Acidimicrobiales bacterium]|nr:cation diffusion facilitator family transporter [Acidimicrobiales bacterium]
MEIRRPYEQCRTDGPHADQWTPTTESDPARRVHAAGRQVGYVPSHPTPREGPLSSESHGTKAILAAFVANLGIAIAKFIGFLITSSGSMLAEAIHSVADTANQALLLFGGRRAKRIADEEHPFGYSRERYFWAFVVAVVLFTMGGVFAVVEGISKVRHPHEVSDIGVAVVILAVAVVLESFSLRTAIGEAKAMVPGDLKIWNFIRKSKSPEVPVVLLEDTAALTGLVLAMSAVLLSHFTGNALWDGLGTISIGVLLLVVATILAIEMKSLLIGEAADVDRADAIRSAVLSGEEVRGVIHLRTEHLGPDDLLVAAKVEFDHALTYVELSDAIDRTEVRVRQVEPGARLLFIEPDVRRDGDEPSPTPT